ncbi:hypothetical protein ABZY32_16515 [Nocardiopsis alba]|uniref:hypothetical protein n=1 Tax=Nocardiopsis alba TaxID=53437 RepID=UPI00339ED1DA
MRHLKSYARTIRFTWIGLHETVDPLTVEMRVDSDGPGRGSYYSTPSMSTQIERYARRLLSHDGELNIHVHPDRREGRITERKLNGNDGTLLGEFTVHRLDEEPPASEVDLSDITTVIEAAVLDPQQVLSVARCRTGAVVRVHCDHTHQVRDVLAETGYTVRIVEGVLLVSLDATEEVTR